MINEKNFVSANEEDIEPSYVDEVVGNHDKADGAHAGKFNAINKKIDETEAFYKDAKDFVGDAADKVGELWGATADAQEKAEAAKGEILSKVSSAERAAEESNMYANAAAAAAGTSQRESAKAKEYSVSAKEDADRAESAVDKIIDDAAKASAAVSVSEAVRDEVRTIKETVSADALKSESAAEEAVRAKGGVAQAEVNAKAYRDEAETAKLGAEKARDDAERCAGQYPYIGPNGNWFVWDDAVSGFIDSGLHAKGDIGEKGDKGDKGDAGADGKDGYTPVKGVDYIDGKDGYTPVKGVDYLDGKDGVDGKDGYTPVKGVDYNDGYTPVKGVDYFDGKDGEDGYTPVRGVDYYTDAEKEEFVAEIKAESAEELAFLSKKVTSIHPHLKYDMKFAIGNLGASGEVGSTPNGIVTSATEPLMFDFDVIVQYNTELSWLWYGIYKNDGTFSRISDTTGYLALHAGTRFRLWFQAKPGVVVENMDNEIFNDLKILSPRDVVLRTSLLNHGIYATESPLDCVKEIYVEGAEDKPIIIGQLRKNYYNSSSGQYWTTLNLSYEDAPTDFVAQFTLASAEPIVGIDEVFKLTANGTKGFSGYALVDYKSVPDGTSYQPRVKVNRVKAFELSVNPVIKAYLDDEKFKKLEAEVDELGTEMSSVLDELHSYAENLISGGAE